MQEVIVAQQGTSESLFKSETNFLKLLFFDCAE